MESRGTVELSLEIEVLSELIEMELLDAELWIWLTLVKTEDTEVDSWWAIADNWMIEVMLRLRWSMDEKARSAGLESLLADIERECPEENSLSSNWEMTEYHWPQPYEQLKNNDITTMSYYYV